MPLLTAKNQVQLHFSTSSFCGDDVPTLLIQLTKADNSPEHFWRTLLTEFNMLDIPFIHYACQHGFPFTPEQQEQCYQAFCESLRERPVILILFNVQLIFDSTVTTFLSHLLELNLPQLYTVLLHGDFLSLSDQSGMKSNKKHESIFPFSREEEMLYYQAQDIHMDNDTLLKIRHFTEGWPAATAAIVEMVKLYGTAFLGDPDAYILLWLEHVYLKRYTRTEIELMVSLYLIDHFELALLQSLVQWKGESLEFYLHESPIVRYHVERKYYTFATYIEPLLNEYRFLLSNKYKENFCQQVGDWYYEHRNKIRAITCYQKSDAYLRSFQVMKKWPWPDSFELAICYADAIDQMSHAFIQKNPFIHIIRAYVLCTLYRYDMAYDILHSFCSLHANKKTLPERLTLILGEAYLVMGYIASIIAKPAADILSHYKTATTLLPTGYSIPNLNLHSDAPLISLSNPQAGALQDNLDLLVQTEQLFHAFSNTSLYAGCVDLAAAEIDYYTRNFATLEIKARKAIQSGLSGRRYDIVCSACFLLMRYNMAKGNYNKMMESLQQVHYYAEVANYPMFFSMPDLADSWLQLKMGNKHKSAEWIRNESSARQKTTPHSYGRGQILHCIYLMENQLYEELLAYIEPALTVLYKRHYNVLIIYLVIMKAIAVYRLKFFDQLLPLVEYLYNWCAPNHIVMPLVEFGSYISPIMEYCLKEDQTVIPKDWLFEIQKKANSYYAYQYQLRRKFELSDLTNENPLKKLTVMEQKLLYNISHGTSLLNTCTLLNVSGTTLKGMTQRLYKKINAINKADASRIAGKYDLDSLIDVAK